jgi:hypothetical protein
MTYCNEAMRIYDIWTAIIDPDCLGDRLAEIVIPDGWTAAKARREWRQHRAVCQKCKEIKEVESERKIQKH